MDDWFAVKGLDGLMMMKRRERIVEGRRNTVKETKNMF